MMCLCLSHLQALNFPRNALFVTRLLSRRKDCKRVFYWHLGGARVCDAFEDYCEHQMTATAAALFRVADFRQTLRLGSLRTLLPTTTRPMSSTDTAFLAGVDVFFFDVIGTVLDWKGSVPEQLRAVVNGEVAGAPSSLRSHKPWQC